MNDTTLRDWRRELATRNLAAVERPDFYSAVATKIETLTEALKADRLTAEARARYSLQLEIWREVRQMARQMPLFAQGSGGGGSAAEVKP